MRDMRSACPDNGPVDPDLREAKLPDKTYFQLIALIAFIVMIGFLIADAAKTTQISVCGAVFVFATLLSLVTGRKEGDEKKS